MTWSIEVMKVSRIRPRRVFESQSWWATVRGAADMETTEWLSTHAPLVLRPLCGERSSEHSSPAPQPHQKEFKAFCLLQKKLIISVSSDLFTLLFS